MDYIVLVEPEGPANIGFIARAMKNFGFKKLVLVNPQCEISLETRKYAMHAWDVVKDAKVLDSFDDVFGLGATLYVGTTAKTNSGTTRASITPKQLAERLKDNHLPIALIFGRESSGLRNDELRKCDIVLNIPTSDEYRAMNLSHAATTVMYEIFSSGASEGQENDQNEIKKAVEAFSRLANSKEINLRNPENAVKMFRNIISRSVVRGSEIKGVIVTLERAANAISRCANIQKKA